ncbi:MAG: PD40 domain-containing protein, partial [Candidatus Eisenbacteria bacterium]|nr:PD40 domain-containing protein [Candidatus Eisenbacteria bacterium]
IDGRAMVSGISDVWMMRADGRGRTRLTDGQSANFGPTFSPDGTIYFTSGRAGSENVWSLVPEANLDPGSVAGSEKTSESMATTIIEEPGGAAAKE